MPDVALKRFQMALEGPFTAANASVFSNNNSSVYNSGSALVATRRLAVEQKVSADIEPVWESPLEARGTYAGAYTHILHQLMAKGKVPAYVYADDLIYYLRMIVSGAPTVTELPGTPQALLAATAIAATMSLSSQPNVQSDGAACKILAITLANGTTNSTPVTVTITGTDVNGNALVEAVVFSAGIQTLSAVGGGAGATTVTKYTVNYFKTVNASGIATSAQPASDTVAVRGINAFQWLFVTDMGISQNGGSTLFSATGEYYDGTASWQIPGIVMEKLSLTATIGKSFKADMSFQAQKKVLLAASTGSINPSANLGTFQCIQNLADAVLPAIPTYTTRIYSDPIGVAPGTTQVAARLTEYKMDLDNVVKLGKAADGTPYPNFVSRGMFGDKLSADMTLLFNSAASGTYDPTDVGNFISNASRTIRAAFPGIALPTGTLSTTGSWPVALQDASSKGGYYGIMIDLAGKLTAMTEKEIEGRMGFQFKLASEVDLVNMGEPLNVTVIARINPNML